MERPFCVSGPPAHCGETGGWETGGSLRFAELPADVALDSDGVTKLFTFGFE